MYACTSPTLAKITHGRQGLCPEWAILTIDGLYLRPKSQFAHRQAKRRLAITSKIWSIIFAHVYVEQYVVPSQTCGLSVATLLMRKPIDIKQFSL